MFNPGENNGAKVVQYSQPLYPDRCTGECTRVPADSTYDSTGSTQSLSTSPGVRIEKSDHANLITNAYV